MTLREDILRLSEEYITSDKYEFDDELEEQILLAINTLFSKEYTNVLLDAFEKTDFRTIPKLSLLRLLKPFAFARSVPKDLIYDYNKYPIIKRWLIKKRVQYRNNPTIKVDKKRFNSADNDTKVLAIIHELMHITQEKYSKINTLGRNLLNILKKNRDQNDGKFDIGVCLFGEDKRNIATINKECEIFPYILFTNCYGLKLMKEGTIDKLIDSIEQSGIIDSDSPFWKWKFRKLRKNI